MRAQKKEKVKTHGEKRGKKREGKKLEYERRSKTMRQKVRY